MLSFLGVSSTNYPQKQLPYSGNPDQTIPRASLFPLTVKGGFFAFSGGKNTENNYQKLETK
jgi:hypothetical protein